MEGYSDLTEWMKDFEDQLMSWSEKVLEVINEGRADYIRDTSQLSIEK